MTRHYAAAQGACVAADSSKSHFFYKHFFCSDGDMDLFVMSYEAGHGLRILVNDGNSGSSPTFSLTGLPVGPNNLRGEAWDAGSSSEVLAFMAFLISFLASRPLNFKMLEPPSVALFSNAAVVDDDGDLDVFSEVALYESDGGYPPTFAVRGYVDSKVGGYEGSVAKLGTTIALLGGNNAADGFVSITFSKLCPAGQQGPLGNSPCSLCPEGSYGGARGIGMESANCSGLCPPGQYSTAGSSVCLPCPAGRYGFALGLSSAACSGPCVASQGAACPPGQVAPNGTACGPGKYSSNDTGVPQCVTCPQGTYGATPSLASPACTGPCMSAPGRVCGPGATSPLGHPCPPGSFSDTWNASACTPCPAGRYGAEEGLSSPACSGAAVVSAGLYPVPGAVAAAGTGAPCPRGKYSLGGAELSCTNCKAGYFGRLPRQTSSDCSGPCPPGQYSDAGAQSCSLCPAGTYGSQQGANWSACSGACVVAPGRYCPAGATAQSVPCPLGLFNSNSSIDSGSGCLPCVAGRFGSMMGLNSSTCSGVCGVGTFSGEGFSACVACTAGKFANTSGAPLCSPCPLGRFGVVGEVNASCSGVCTPSPGRFCAVGASSSSGDLCALGQYSTAGSMESCDRCPPGSTCGGVSAIGGAVASTPCPSGQYSSSDSLSCELCPAGRYGNVSGVDSPTCNGPCPMQRGIACPAGLASAAGSICPSGQYSDSAGAVACKPCPPGRFGSSPGLQSASCTGSCVPIAGTYCGPGATAASGVACPPGRYSVSGNMSSCTPW